METPHLEHPVLNCAWILIHLRFSVDVHGDFKCASGSVRISKISQYQFTAWRAWQTESLIKCLLTLRIKSVIVEASQKFPGWQTSCIEMNWPGICPFLPEPTWLNRSIAMALAHICSGRYLFLILPAICRLRKAGSLLDFRMPCTLQSSISWSV